LRLILAVYVSRGQRFGLKNNQEDAISPSQQYVCINLKNQLAGYCSRA
jgi:hypothetical protein